MSFHTHAYTHMHIQADMYTHNEFLALLTNLNNLETSTNFSKQDLCQVGAW